MRRLLLLALVACGPKVSSTPQPQPAEAPDAGVVETATVTVVLPTNFGVRIACAGDVEGVGGGPACDDEAVTTVVAGCTDGRGPVRGEPLIADDMLMPFTLLGEGVEPVVTPKTDPRDKRDHQVDLDGDGERETITLVPHDNRASYGRSLSIVDGHDPLMIDATDPFPDAADLQLLGTSDVDGDGRRELILYAPDEGGYGIAVQEHWAPAEAYRLDCRNP